LKKPSPASTARPSSPFKDGQGYDEQAVKATTGQVELEAMLKKLHLPSLRSADLLLGQLVPAGVTPLFLSDRVKERLASLARIASGAISFTGLRGACSLCPG
jgi:hypothetical protein